MQILSTFGVWSVNVLLKECGYYDDVISKVQPLRTIVSQQCTVDQEIFGAKIFLQLNFHVVLFSSL